MARKIFHLWTAFSGGRADAAIRVATWASVSDRRPKGVVGVCDCMSLPRQGKEKLPAKTAPKRLTVIRGSVILRAPAQRRGFRNGDVTGAFFFCLGFSCIVRLSRSNRLIPAGQAR